LKKPVFPFWHFNAELYWWAHPLTHAPKHNKQETMHDLNPPACAYTAIANISRDIYTFKSRAGWLSLKMLAAELCQGCG
jgi:hypothetical protein